MTKSANAAKPKWQKIAWAALLLLLVGYHFGRPTLEKMTGLSLPSLDGQPAATAVDDGEDQASSNDLVGNAETNNQEGSQTQASSKKTQQSTKSTTKRNNGSSGGSEFKLQTIGRNTLKSPAGLVYRMGPRGEHRVDHVMRHGKDDTSRPSHGVFVGDKDQILKLLDEAYGLIKSKSNRAKSTRERDRTKNIVDMRRKVGYEGGQKGKRNGNRELKKVMLILQDGDQVITAYPYR